METALLPGSKLTQGTDRRRASLVPASAPGLRLLRSPGNAAPPPGGRSRMGREAHAPPGGDFWGNPRGKRQWDPQCHWAFGPGCFQARHPGSRQTEKPNILSGYYPILVLYPVYIIIIIPRMLY